MRDIHNNVKNDVALNIQAIVSDTTTVGSIIDLQDYDGCEFVIQSGTLTDGLYTPLIEYGDDSGLSDAAAVPDKFLLGTEADAALGGGSPTPDNEIGKVGVKAHSGKRYVRLSLVSTGVTSGGTIGATVCRGPMRLPV